MLDIRTILHPTDFSNNAAPAWHVACALARDYRARLILLHVHRPPVVAYGEFGMLPPEALDREALENELAAIQPTHPELEVARSLAEGEEAEEIVRFALDNQCDLIVMGTHGRKGLGRLLMGSVAEEVVRKAACPVLTVKKPLAEIETGFTAVAQPATA